MLSWNDYEVKQEQYKDMQRAADQRRLLHEAQAHQQRRQAWQSRMLRWLGRSMMHVGARLEQRYSS